MLKSDPSTWTDVRHREGLDAERRAAAMLTRSGYEILEHRFRHHRHDIDLVARRGSLVVFVEVRYRADARFGTPAQSVTPRKCLELARAAAAWMQRHGRQSDTARFDVIAMQGDKVSWIQAAFRPGWR